MYKNIHRTKWAKWFKKESPFWYQLAIEYATNPETKYVIFKSFEMSIMGQWGIVVQGTEFWMAVFDKRSEAIELCDKMGLEFF